MGFAIVFVAIAALGQPQDPPLRPQQATPEKTLETFVAAWNKRDEAALYPLVMGAKPNAAFKSFMKSTGRMWPKLEITVRGVDPGAGQARVTSRVNLTQGQGKPTPRTYFEIIRMTNDNGNWKLVPAQTPEEARQPIAGLARYILGEGFPKLERKG
jgi:hypothetical protein